mmetsp:Transcript_12470/g.38781  ORF Transcript_12470/g.38781 Transcript_12470/m.38781 type:complete len:227 (+) Transcript_12470:404-1084(+)
MGPLPVDSKYVSHTCTLQDARDSSDGTPTNPTVAVATEEDTLAVVRTDARRMVTFKGVALTWHVICGLTATPTCAKPNTLELLRVTLVFVRSSDIAALSKSTCPACAAPPKTAKAATPAPVVATTRTTLSVALHLEFGARVKVVPIEKSAAEAPTTAKEECPFSMAVVDETSTVVRVSATVADDAKMRPRDPYAARPTTAVPWRDSLAAMATTMAASISVMEIPLA